LTNKEYISYCLGRFGATDADLNIILEKYLLSENADAEPRVIEEAVYNELPLIIAGLSNVSEGGYSISWNIEGLKMYYSSLASTLGKENKLSSKLIYIGDRW